VETADVLIVGGGPAGSSCAWKLRQSGVDVLLLDKAQFPRHKVCAGWITPPIVDALKLDVADFRSRHVMQPITRFLTGFIGGREIETDYSDVVSYGIRRCEFDDYLLRRTGARLTLGESFRSMRRDGRDWIVNDKFRAPILVGAGGHFCPVARQLSSSATSAVKNGGDAKNDESPATADVRRPHSGLPVVMAQEVEFEMTAEQQVGCTVERDRPELFFCPDLRGYGWVFRKENYLNIGIGREAEEHLSTHVAKFVEYLRVRNKVTFPLIEKFRGHAYALRTQLPRITNEAGVVLIGDAVGLANRQSGEGIRPAIESGLICADSILGLKPEQRDQLNEVYLKRLRDHFRHGTTSSPLADWIPGSLRQFMAQRLMNSRWFARRILLDQWFLHR
jgi:flavin-dependent dehydrogenase